MNASSEDRRPIRVCRRLRMDLGISLAEAYRAVNATRRDDEADYFLAVEWLRNNTPIRERKP